MKELKLSYFKKTHKKPPKYLVDRGKTLATANKQCAGTPNKQGQFYRCVKTKLKKIF